MCSVSSNVQLPVLPEARIEMRNVMRFPQNAAAGAILRASIAKDHGKLASERQFKITRKANFAGEI